MSRVTWDTAAIEQLAPDAKSVAAARKLLTQDRFSAIEPTADGLGWWAKCRGETGEYEVSARPPGARGVRTSCTCESRKSPCKHALALLIQLAARGGESPQKPEPEPAAGGDYEALLNACFADPADDLARLVLADYLEERGDADWARLLRIQVEVERPDGAARGARAAVKGEARLVKALLGSLPKLTEGEFTARRGFLHYRTENAYSVSAANWPASVVALFRQGRVESVTFAGYSVAVGVPAAVELLRCVGEIRLSALYRSDETLRRFAAEVTPGEPGSRLQRVVVPEADRARWESLLADPGGGPVPDESGRLVLADPLPARVARQADAGDYRGTRHLTISGRLTPETAAAIAGCPDLMHATDLTFAETQLTTETASILAGPATRAAGATFRNVAWSACAADAWLGSEWVARVAALTVDSTAPFADADVRELAARRYPLMTRLEVAGHGPSAAHARLMAVAPGLASLDSLAVAGGPVDAAEALRLRLDPATRHLTRLQLGEHIYWLSGSDGVGGLCLGVGPAVAAAWPPESAALDWSIVKAVALDGASVPPDWFPTLAACFSGGLASLSLAHCGLRVAEAKALAAVLPLLRPARLNLTDNRLGPVALRELLRAGALDSVEDLDLSNNALTAPALRLLASAYPPRLKCLTLRGTDAGVSRADRDALDAALAGRAAVTW